MANSHPRDHYPIKEQIIAHRGASGHAPENTLAAIRLAKELGCHWIEVDVTISSDRVAVIFHDETLERCTNGNGFVTLSPWSELQKLDAGTWFSTNFCDENILSLDQLLDAAIEYGLNVNLEIKPIIGLEYETMSSVIKTIRQRTHWPTLLISSFSERCLSHAQKELNDIPRALNVESIPHDWRCRLTAIDACALHFAREFIDQERIKQICQEYAISCYTVNAAQPAEQLFELGVDAIFTDLPDLFLNSPV